jgi:methyl-accepting chemotaxis protein
MIRSWSFKKKLQFALGLLSFIALANVGYLAYQLQHSIVGGKKDLLGRSAEAISDKIDRNLFERYGDVQAFALSEPARSGDRDRITKFMTDMMSAYAPIYDVMLVLDTHGTVIAANSVDKNGKALDARKMIGKNYADRDWFVAAVGGKIQAGQAHFTDLRVDADTATYASTDGKVMNFTAPIKDARTGEILGVWSNRMSWKDVVDDIIIKESQKLKDEKLPTVAGYLINQEKTYLFHHDESKVLKAKATELDGFLNASVDTSVHEIADQDQIKAQAIEVITAEKGYASFPGQKWSLVLRGPASDGELRFAYLSASIGLFLIFAVAIMANVIVSRTGKSLEEIIGKLQDGSSQVSKTAAEVTDASHSLSQASTQQASALQETAASIEEINAMIIKSTENSRRSQDVAGQSSDIAKKGKDSVDQMSDAIKEINVSNEAILKQIGESNGQISDIARVIAEIGNKTKVINDIVFQTKLLSFNASVEAARAGEHGKGFAVVAEEVGNLAQMSGNAAKEIADMLSESIQNVESIVQNTKSKVDGLIADGRKKVQSGIVIADQCGQVLSDVVGNVDELGIMVTEISTASHEQSQGVNEITKAMNELDQTTHSNATTSQQVASYADALTNESQHMDAIVIELSDVVKGVGSSQRSNQQSDHRRSSKEKGAKTNVLALQRNDSAKSSARAKILKQASGDSIPASEDPRFEDV